MRKLSHKLPACVLLLVGVTGVVASSCKNNTISSNYNASSNEAGPVDTTAATTASPSATGTASAPPSRCTPGTKRCPGGATGPVLETCAQDGAWVAENCPSAFPLCKLDKCVEECAPNATRCEGDSTQKCQSDRTWGAATPCPASDPICSGAGTCGKTCGAAGDTRCTGNTIETCDGARTWGSPVACSGGTPKCLNGTPATCGIIDCTPPGESGCLGTTRRTCNADSTWAPGSPCSGGTPACLETPGAPKSAACVECSSGSACLDARTPKTCVGGAWTPSAACNVGSECKAATGTCGSCTGSVGAAVWTQLPTGAIPPRGYGAMAYDSADASMLVFGGLNGWASGVGNTSVLGDTWRLRGSVWTQLNPARSPSARLHHRMASDTTHGKVYLFGGQGAPGATRNNELWEWSGGNWTQLCTTAPCNAMMPTARAIAGLAYDTARDRLVLVGGQEQDNSGANDMWEWDGVAWSLVCGKSAPSCGIVSRDLYGGIAYDEARRRIVYLDAGVNYEFDGVAWTRPASSSAPPFTSAVFSNVFDATRGTLVALGNYGGGAPATTPHVWEWNGACWADTVPGGGVAHGLYGQVMAYDPPNKRLVRFGGEMPWTGTPPQTYSANIWERSSL